MSGDGLSAPGKSALKVGGEVFLEEYAAVLMGCLIDQSGCFCKNEQTLRELIDAGVATPL